MFIQFLEIVFVKVSKLFIKLYIYLCSNEMTFTGTHQIESTFYMCPGN